MITCKYFHRKKALLFKKILKKRNLGFIPSLENAAVWSGSSVENAVVRGTQVYNFRSWVDEKWLNAYVAILGCECQRFTILLMQMSKHLDINQTRRLLFQCFHFSLSTFQLFTVKEYWGGVWKLFNVYS